MTTISVVEVLSAQQQGRLNTKRDGQAVFPLPTGYLFSRESPTAASSCPSRVGWVDEAGVVWSVGT
jgi:hypothetical protein